MGASPNSGRWCVWIRSRRFVLDGKPVLLATSYLPAALEAAKLRLPARTPVMLICRTAFAEDGRVVEVNEMVLDAAAYVLEYDFDA